MSTKPKEYINKFEWGFSYAVNIHLPRPLKQLKSSEEAIKKGYVPTATPNVWAIQSNNFRSERVEGKDSVRTVADLILDEVDIGYDTKAYVPTGKHWSDSGPTIFDNVDQFLISAQFYKK
jgi:hypothetical protein